MLFAVEGGGFFSAAASGYSKGLTLLLLGQKNEDRPMRVSPWNHSQFGGGEPDPDLQLASFRNRLSHGCASCIFYRCSSPELDSSSHLKVGPTQQPDALPNPLVSEKHVTELGEGNGNARKVTLRSSLKKPSNGVPARVEKVVEQEVSGEAGNEEPAHTEGRKVQWTDNCGNELSQIREFEPSEKGGSDDEFDGRHERACSCAIM